MSAPPRGRRAGAGVGRGDSAGRAKIAELQAQLAFLREVLDLDPSLIFAKDRDGRFTFANRAVASIYGVAPSELVGKTDADFNPDNAEIEHFRLDDLEVMDSLEPKLIEKEPVTSPDGATRWFQTIKIPIVSPDGRANAVLGVSADITGRKEAEDVLQRRTRQLLRHQAALRELAVARPADLKTAMERMLRTASATLDVERAGVWLFDAELTTLRAECVLEGGALLATPATGVAMRDHADYVRALKTARVLACEDVRTDARTRSMLASYLEPLGIVSMLDVAILSHGTPIGVVCLEHRGAPRGWTIEEVDFAVSVSDLVALALEESKREVAEARLRQAQKMEAIGLVAGGISHDFNNLLNIIVGHAELAARQLPPGHGAAGHVATIAGACARAAELVRKILTFSRGQVLRFEAVDFGAVLREFSELLGRVLGEDVELTVSTADEPMIVYADRSQLEQVVLNLCANARQAMPKGGRLTIDARPVHVDEEPAGLYVRLLVADTGHGMDEAVMSRLWEPFFTTKSEGTGLGLSMVYGIVKQHGGLIRAESIVGRGSTFHVFLPVHRGPAARQPAPAVSRDLRGFETILVAENEPLIRDLVKVALSERGYTVLVAEDGADAVAVFERHPASIDLVILDVVMSKLSGVDALSRMEQLKPGQRALFISGHAPESAHLSDHLRKAGRAFLPKPFRLVDLAAVVRELLNGAPRV